MNVHPFPPASLLQPSSDLEGAALFRPQRRVGRQFFMNDNIAARLRRTQILRIVFILGVLLFFLLPLFLHWQRPTQEIERQWELLDWNAGRMRVVLCGTQSEKELHQIANLAFQEILRLDKVINEYKPQSEAGALCLQMEKGKQNIPVSEELFSLLEFAMEVSKNSSGAFDITVRPWIQLWKECGQQNRLPSDKELENVRQNAGWQHLRLDKTKREVSFSCKRLSVAMGAFTKGYGVDQMVALLRKHGISSGMVSLAGDLKGFGKRQWKVGIQDPRITDASSPESIIGIIAVEEMAVSTSGHYRRYTEIQGKRYSHIFDPMSGRPVPMTTVSATVLAPSSMKADAYATAFCVLPVEKALQIAQQQKLHAAIITQQGSEYKLHTTPGFEKFWVKKPCFGTGQE
jgi:thiamine biosynthesis lipoprotein